MSKKKVCFLGQFPPPIHGLSKALDTLYNSDLNTEFEFSKIDLTSNKRFILNLLKLLFSRADLYYLTISQSKMGNLRDLILMTIILLKRKPGLIHLHGGYYRVLVDHDVSRWQRSLNYAIVRHMSGAIVLGQSLRHIFIGMIDESKIFIVQNCVDDEYRLTETEIEKKISRLSRQKTQHVLYLSNMIRSKGYYRTLQLALASKSLGGYVFDFAGAFFEEAEKKTFFKYIQDNGLEDIVFYHGVVSGEKKKTLLRNATYFILLSRYPKEGQPISLLEAMGSGNVVITTDHAGIPDIVTNGLNGIIVGLDYTESDILNRIAHINIKKVMLENFRETTSAYTEEKYVKKMLAIFNARMSKDALSQEGLEN